MSQPLMKRLLDEGYPITEIAHHESDLYVYVTPLTTKIVNEYCRENGFTRDWHCPIFKDAITGKPMYDCAFQYMKELMMAVDATFVSVWDDGIEITSDCQVNMETKEVFNIKRQDVDGLDDLIEETVVISGKSYPVAQKDEYEGMGFWYE
ncbi:MAG: hypothetical protein NC084_06390 [Bacteroides sp.]|nr:hypothetical protein [Eubacterium sp.]MCM1418147.1 hypothetical protein [Roseburia sp.]MCM1462328.1 hypothetical protein [Bacteroides sp.]